MSEDSHQRHVAAMERWRQSLDRIEEDMKQARRERGQCAECGADPMRAQGLHHEGCPVDPG